MSPDAAMRPSTHHMHLVGRDVVEQPPVVRDEHEAAVGAAQPVDAGSHLAQGVDVQARVDFIEHGQPGLEHRELQDLVALALAAREAFVDVAREQGLVEAEFLRLGLDRLQEIVGIDLGFAASPAPRVERRPQQVGVVDTRATPPDTGTPGTARDGRALPAPGPAGRRRRAVPRRRSPHSPACLPAPRPACSCRCRWAP